MSPQKQTSEANDEYEWVQIQAKIERTQLAETGSGRITRQLMQNPFVPIGCLATVTALVVGVKNFYRGDHKKQQVMMRARVGAQGFTIMALVGGLFYQAFAK